MGKLVFSYRLQFRPQAKESNGPSVRQDSFNIMRRTDARRIQPEIGQPGTLTECSCWG